MTPKVLCLSWLLAVQKGPDIEVAHVSSSSKTDLPSDSFINFINSLEFDVLFSMVKTSISHPGLGLIIELEPIQHTIHFSP